MQVGQALELRVEKGRLIIEPAGDSLDDLLGRITPENLHGLSMEDSAKGAEAW
jgi:antitoxin MazE